LAGLAGNKFLTRNMLQQFFKMKTSASSLKYTLRHFKLGNISTRHNHLLSIVRNFYYDAMKLLQADN